MLEKGITAHVIVKNEEKWIWFAIMSIIEYVDKLIIFDTGSTDHTVNIIMELIQDYDKNQKIIFEQKNNIAKENFYKLRQEQIQRTNTEWFLVLDGDEIWYSNTIKKVSDFIKENTKYKMIAIKFHNCVGDIYHYKKFESESYNIKGIIGSITIRLFSKSIDNIHCNGEYGIEGYFDSNNLEVQNRVEEIYIMDGFYFHTSYLQRSRSIFKDWEIVYRREKVFGRIDGHVDSNFKFPEVFYCKKPNSVSNPFLQIGVKYYTLKLFAYFVKALKKIKNKVVRNGIC